MTAGSPDPTDDGNLYGACFFAQNYDRPYRRDEFWLDYWGRIADRIVRDLEPVSVLDAGCSIGLLVEVLRERGVEAFGFDVSSYAIDQVHESVRPHCWQGSVTEPLDRHYDLVVCSEVVEHLDPDDASRAIDNICAATDRVLFSSSPSDFAEPTHRTVRPPEYWSAEFARRGFVRDLDNDPLFLASWAAIYQRSRASLPEVVRAYDRHLARLTEEVTAVRSRLVELQSRLEQVTHPDLAQENHRLRRELFEAREAVDRTEVALAEAQARAEAGEERLDAILGSRTHKVFGPYHRVRARLRSDG